MTYLWGPGRASGRLFSTRKNTLYMAWELNGCWYFTASVCRHQGSGFEALGLKRARALAVSPDICLGLATPSPKT